MGDSEQEERPKPPDGSGIGVKLIGRELTLIIPGRWPSDLWFPLTINGVLLCGSVVAYLVLGEILICAIAAFCIVLTLFLFYVVKPRTETITFTPADLTVSGSYGRRRNPRRFPTERLGGFIIRCPGLQHRVAANSSDRLFGLFLPERHVVLFATTSQVSPGSEVQAPRRSLFIAFTRMAEFLAWSSSASPRPLDIPMAVQARETDLPWLRDIMAGHLARIRSRQGSSVL